LERTVTQVTGCTLRLPWRQVGFGLEPGAEDDPVAPDDEWAASQAEEAYQRLFAVGLNARDPVDLYGYLHGQVLTTALLGDPRFCRVIERLPPIWEYDLEGCVVTLRQAYSDNNYYLAHYASPEARSGAVADVPVELGEITALQWLSLAQPTAIAWAHFRQVAARPAQALVTLCDDLRHVETVKRSKLSGPELLLLNMQCYAGMWGLAHLQDQLNEADTTDEEDRLLWALVGITFRCFMLAMPRDVQRTVADMVQILNEE
jgi:hypothetical protein